MLILFSNDLKVFDIGHYDLSMESSMLILEFLDEVHEEIPNL